jgi:hypothetical protein
MAIRSGFFNSINGDRKYDARRFAEYFASFIGNGVFPDPSNNLQVVSNNDMTITVKAGKAWINGYILINDDDYILQIDPADGVLNRIDRVVARYDVVDREIRLEVKKGDFATNAVAKELQRDADAYELGLADIAVNAGIISITQANLTDLRLHTELCGIVHGTVEQVDTTALFDQYLNWYQQTTVQAETDLQTMQQHFEQDFDAWYQTLQDVLDDNAASNLLNMINTHKDNLENPHNVTKDQVGLGNIDNVKQATQAAFDTHKADNVSHRTQAEKEKLSGIESGARKLANVDDVKQMPLAGGTFTGTVKAHPNTGYTTAQIRNVILSTANADADAMQNGDIWFKYGDA